MGVKQFPAPSGAKRPSTVIASLLAAALGVASATPASADPPMATAAVASNAVPPPGAPPPAPPRPEPERSERAEQPRVGRSAPRRPDRAQPAPRDASGRGRARRADRAGDDDGGDEESGVRWSRHWSGFRLVNYLTTGAAGLGIIAAQLALPKPTVARWQGAILLDGATRSAMMNGDFEGRRTIGNVSDMFLYGMIAMPFIDAGIALAVHGDPEVAAQMFAINAQSMAITVLITEITKRVIGRERPYGDRCDPTTSNGECSSGSRYESFLSGHTSMAFTAAGLMCAHHENLPLYGGGVADRMACYGALGAAAAVGAMRIMADRHYLSDVLAGAALGLISGYVLPKFLHYELDSSDDDEDDDIIEVNDEVRRARRERAQRRRTISPLAGPSTVGVTYEQTW